MSDLQKKLKNMGYDPGKIDGKFGPKTKRALSEFQKQHGLKPTGNFDKNTANKLSEAVRKNNEMRKLFKEKFPNKTLPKADYSLPKEKVLAQLRNAKYGKLNKLGFNSKKLIDALKNDGLSRKEVAHLLSRASIENPSGSHFLRCNYAKACGLVQMKLGARKEAYKTSSLIRQKYGSFKRFNDAFMGKYGRQEAALAQFRASHAYSQRLRQLVPAVRGDFNRENAAYNYGPSRVRAQSKSRNSVRRYVQNKSASPRIIGIRETRNYVIDTGKNRRVFLNSGNVRQLKRVGGRSTRQLWSGFLSGFNSVYNPSNQATTNTITEWLNGIYANR